jgi:hypothetical protein
MKSLPCISALALSALAFTAAHAADVKPLKILLITGGCCHDYNKQKDILKTGLEARINATVDQVHTPDSSERPPLPIYGNPEYAKGYDLVIHDECAARISEPETIKGVIKPHMDGTPGVNLHCAMHCYRIGNPGEPAAAGSERAMWFDYLGLQSSGHGPQQPISITFTNQPLVKGLENWTTINEELYNNIQIFPSATPLAAGAQIVKGRDGTSKTNTYVVAWLNSYGPKKTKVFSTTIGHNNTTVQDDKYLDLVTRGVLWATGHIKEDGTPAAGYAKSK